MEVINSVEDAFGNVVFWRVGYPGGGLVLCHFVFCAFWCLSFCFGVLFVENVVFFVSRKRMKTHTVGDVRFGKILVFGFGATLVDFFVTATPVLVSVEKVKIKKVRRFRRCRNWEKARSLKYLRDLDFAVFFCNCAKLLQTLKFRKLTMILMRSILSFFSFYSRAWQTIRMNFWKPMIESSRIE